MDLNAAAIVRFLVRWLEKNAMSFYESFWAPQGERFFKDGYSLYQENLGGDFSISIWKNVLIESKYAFRRNSDQAILLCPKKSKQSQKDWCRKSVDAGEGIEAIDLSEKKGQLMVQIITFVESEEIAAFNANCMGNILSFQPLRRTHVTQRCAT